jgi:hypothetical protein
MKKTNHIIIEIVLNVAVFGALYLMFKYCK